MTMRGEKVKKFLCFCFSSRSVYQKDTKNLNKCLGVLKVKREEFFWWYWFCWMMNLLLFWSQCQKLFLLLLLFNVEKLIFAHFNCEEEKLFGKSLRKFWKQKMLFNFCRSQLMELFIYISKFSFSRANNFEQNYSAHCLKLFLLIFYILCSQGQNYNVLSRFKVRIFSQSQSNNFYCQVDNWVFPLTIHSNPYFLSSIKPNPIQPNKVKRS